MKARPDRLSSSLLAITFALSAPMSHAADGSWTNAAPGDWSTGPWTGGVPNGSGETATFSQDWTGQVINLDVPVTVGRILATDSAANGGLAINGGSLTLSNGASQPVIGTGPNTNFGESAANRFRIGSVLEGSDGFERQGSGYLDLSGVAHSFTGTIKLTAPASGGGSFTVINNDANLGNAANPVTVALNSQPVGFYNDGSAGAFTLNANRSITTSGTGDFWVKNKAGANMTIAGVISGTARLRKNDAGTLTLTAANTHSGNTLLDGGTLVLSGGDNRLPAGSTLTFNSASSLDLTNTSQTLNGLGLLGAGQTNTIKGGGGTLILGGSGDYTVNTTVTGTSLDMAGLDNFTFNRPSNSLQLNANGANVVNTIHLAKAGTNTINATNVRFGGGSNNAGQDVLIGLGQDNRINASGEFVIGFFQGNGNVSFQSGLGNPVLTVRGAGGAGATPLMTVGSTNSGNRASVGILNLTGGSLDVLATELNVARHFANAGGTSATGTVTMPAGTVVAGTLNLASKTNTTGAPTLTGTFNQGGGTVTATTVNLGSNLNAEAPNLIANYNLHGGELRAASITGTGTTYGAGTVRNLSLNGGTLRNLADGDLAVNGVANTATGRIHIIAGASGGTLVADAGRTISLGANTALNGSGPLTKAGSGTLVINGASSTFTGTLTVNSGTLAGETAFGGNLAIAGGGTLAPGNSSGTMTVAGDLTIDGTYAFEFNDAGDGADLVNVGGTLDLGGALVTWDNLGIHQPGEKFTLFAYDALAGAFSGYADDSEHTLDGGLWRLDYNDTTPGLNGGLNDGGVTSGFVTITAVPEPGAALLGGLGLLALLRRRRQ
jgi:autotransporter-associated beta strand protein